MDNIRNPHLTRDNDLGETEKTMATAVEMTEALQAGSNDMEAHFHPDFRWMANTGCGNKNGIAEFRRNWQLPLCPLLPIAITLKKPASHRVSGPRHLVISMPYTVVNSWG